MRAASAACGLFTMLLLVATFATGFVFHAEPYSETRNAWFAWHRTVGLAVPVLALPAAIIAVRHARRAAATACWLRRGAWLLLIGLRVTGWLAVSAWADPDGSGTLIGGVRLPLLPGVSRAVGNSGEQMHKLFATLMVWLLAAYLGRAVWLSLGKKVS